MKVEEKYKPKRVEDLVFADSTAKAICERYATSKPYKPLMLWGPPGTAKTTTARVIAFERHRRAGYEGEPEEFNGAELTAKNFNLLENMANFLEFSTGGDTILIINEFDELTREDQAKFRAWMDQYTWVNLLVTTNEQPGVQGVRQKIIPALQSRFELVELAPPSLDDWLPRVQDIFLQEGYPVSEAHVRQLLSSFSGDVREILPLIEAALDGLRVGAPPQAPVSPTLRVVHSQPPTR